MHFSYHVSSVGYIIDFVSSLCTLLKSPVLIVMSFYINSERTLTGRLLGGVIDMSTVMPQRQHVIDPFLLADTVVLQQSMAMRLYHIVIYHLSSGKNHIVQITRIMTLFSPDYIMKYYWIKTQIQTIWPNSPSVVCCPINSALHEQVSIDKHHIKLSNLGVLTLDLLAKGVESTLIWYRPV